MQVERKSYSSHGFSRGFTRFKALRRLSHGVRILLAYAKDVAETES